MTAASPGLYEQVLVARGARDGGALIEGIVPDYERTVSNILINSTPGAVERSGAAAGRVASASNAILPPIVLGAILQRPSARPLAIHVMLISPQGEMTPFGVMSQSAALPRSQAPSTRAFINTTAQLGFLRLADAQRLFDEPDLLSVISFKVDDLNRAPQIAKEIEQAAGPGFMTTNWMEQNRELFRALKLEQIVTFIVIALIVIVAALNILIALTMMVMEKTRDIAVLMSFGVDPGQVRRIFLMQGLLISVVGTAIGLVLGYLASWAGGHYHFIHLSAEVYSIDTLPFAPRAARWRDCRRSLNWNFDACDVVPFFRRRADTARRSAALRVESLLRCDDAAHGVAARQNDAAMIHFCGRALMRCRGEFFSFNQRATACGTPVGLRLRRQYRPAMGTDSLHAASLSECVRNLPELRG